jgi:hypothetical protein
MPRIVVADPIHPDGIERLAAAPGVTLDHPGTANGSRWPTGCATPTG